MVRDDSTVARRVGDVHLVRVQRELKSSNAAFVRGYRDCFLALSTHPDIHVGGSANRRASASPVDNPHRDVERLVSLRSRWDTEEKPPHEGPETSVRHGRRHQLWSTIEYRQSTFDTR